MQLAGARPVILALSTRLLYAVLWSRVPAGPVHLFPYLRELAWQDY